MDFNSTIDLIVRELEEACEIIDDLKKSPDAPIIQIELAKSKCRNAATAIALLKSIKNQENTDHLRKSSHHHSAPETREALVPDEDYEEKHRPEKMAEKKKEEELPARAHGKQHSEPDPGKKEPVKTEPFTAKTEQADIEETDPDLVISAENDEDKRKPYVAPIIADSFSHLANRFNEQMGREDDELSHLRKKHVSRLADAIGVNDKFYYIREVFDGNKEAYTTALSHLESIDNLEEAIEEIMNHRKHKTDNEAVQQLLELVKRKLSPDE